MDIKNKIYTIRGKQVMLDRDLAELYEVQTRDLNKAVKRNSERFPSDFVFQLTKNEYENLMFQTGTSSYSHGGVRKLPNCFTEQGVAMLSGVLRSKIATKVNISIMRAFVEMKRFLSQNAEVFSRLDKLERKQIEHDHKFEKVFQAISDKRT